MGLDVVVVDEGAIAGHYSQLCAVLAGFAFAALFHFLSREMGDDVVDVGEGRVVLLMMTAFFGLMLASLGYSVVAGLPDREAALMHVVVGTGFGSSTLPLIAAIHVMAVRRLPRIHKMTARLAGSAAPMVVIVFVLEGSWGAIEAHGLGAVASMRMMLLFVIVPVSVLPVLALLRPRVRAWVWRRGDHLARSVALSFPHGVAWVGVLSTVALAILLAFPPETDFAKLTLLATSTGVVLVMGVWSRLALSVVSRDLNAARRRGNPSMAPTTP